jgi:hypothetical protein
MSSAVCIVNDLMYGEDSDSNVDESLLTCIQVYSCRGIIIFTPVKPLDGPAENLKVVMHFDPPYSVIGD